MSVTRSKDFWAGLMFAAFGAAFMIVARNYNMGSALRMGPAYFPTVIGGLLLVLGLVVILKSFFVASGAVPRMYLRPLVIVLVAVCLFGALLQHLGLVVASVAMIVVGALGGREFRWKEVLLLTVILVVFAVAVFVYGLGLPFPLWPGQ